MTDRGQEIIEAHHQRLIAFEPVSTTVHKHETQADRCQRILGLAARYRVKLRRASTMTLRKRGKR